MSMSSNDPLYKPQMFFLGVSCSTCNVVKFLKISLFSMLSASNAFTIKNLMFLFSLLSSVSNFPKLKNESLYFAMVEKKSFKMVLI